MKNEILIYGLTENWGGVEAIVMNLVSHMADKCNFTILVPDANSSYCKKIDNSIATFKTFTSWGSSRRAFCVELKDILINKSFDYVWINSCLMSNKDIVSVVKKYSKAKIITHSHGSSFEEGNKVKAILLKLLHYANRKYYIKNIDYYCCCSLLSAQWFYGKKNCELLPIHVINNGVDITKFQFDNTIREQYRQELGLDNYFTILHAGRLTAVKNQFYLLDVMKRLCDHGQKVKMLIAGDGELREDLEAYASKNGISDSTIFLGYRSDVSNLYQCADCFILPSLHEGLPVTIVEAQTSGLPCFVSANITQEADISGRVIFIPITVSPQEWAVKIEQVIHQSIDRKLVANEIRRRGYDIADISNNFLKHIGAYDK